MVVGEHVIRLLTYIEKEKIRSEDEEKSKNYDACINNTHNEKKYEATC